jgi:hypothetical protein
LIPDLFNNSFRKLLKYVEDGFWAHLPLLLGRLENQKVVLGFQGGDGSFKALAFSHGVS